MLGLGLGDGGEAVREEVENSNIFSLITAIDCKFEAHLKLHIIKICKDGPLMN